MGKCTETECNWGGGIQNYDVKIEDSFSAKKGRLGSGCSTVLFGGDYRFSREYSSAWLNYIKSLGNEYLVTSV